MPLTMRTVQKMFTASRRGRRQPVVPGQHDRQTLGRLARFVSGKEISEAVVKEGRLFNFCNCNVCRQQGTFVDGGQSAIDRLTRKHGPDADLEQVLNDEFNDRADEQQGNEQQQQQTQNGSGNSQGRGRSVPQPSSSNPQQGQSQQGQSSSSSGSSGQRAQTTGPAPQTAQPAQTAPHPAARPFEPPQPKTPTDAEKRAAAAKAAQAEAKKALEQAAQELKKAREAARKTSDKKAAVARIAKAKKKVKAARVPASFDAFATASAPSLRARRAVSSGQGRLQRVPSWLRNQMADLINRLVMRGGAAGENPSAVPLLSAPKVVKRMLVRRPLSNAFKEDIITGRPVTVFLPDISGSCAAQAQIACDIANAAGFVGVSGSDVLVFPHFNGQVRASPEYIPWFNGKPVTTNYEQIRTLFEDVCAGKSKFKVRVVIVIGDHDGVERYGDIAEMKSVTQLIWLHNLGDADGMSKAPPQAAPPHMIPNKWCAEALRKLTMLVGCGSQRTMLQGLKATLQSR